MNDGPSVRGRFGESKVNAAIKIALDGNEYSLLRDVILPTQAGTTQIDHVVISKFGIFVVETKNYSGWIFGGEYQGVWKQTLFDKKTSFQNPLRQNYKHTTTIVELLGIDHAKVFSIVVFVGESEFKTPMPNNVTDIDGMIKFIKSKTVELFTGDEVGSILNAFDVIRIESSVENLNNHIDSLKSTYSRRNNQDGLENSSEIKIEQRHTSKHKLFENIFKKFSTRSSLSSKNLSSNIDNNVSILNKMLAAINVVRDFFSHNVKRKNSRNFFIKFRYLFYVKSLVTVLAVAIICLLIATTFGNKIQPERSDSRAEIDQLKTDTFSKKTIQIDNKPKQEIRKIYLIELTNGRTIQVDNLTINGKIANLINENGLEMKLDLSQIKSVKSVQL